MPVLALLKPPLNFSASQLTSQGETESLLQSPLETTELEENVMTMRRRGTVRTSIVVQKKS